MQSLTQHTEVSTLIQNEYCVTNNQQHWLTGMPLKVCRWLMAAGKRPVPFRTRKLSPPAPMVLHSGGCGRVGYRRPNNFKHSTPHTTKVCGVLFVMPRGTCTPRGWNEFVISARFSGVCPGGGNSITTSFHHTTTTPPPQPVCRADTVTRPHHTPSTRRKRGLRGPRLGGMSAPEQQDSNGASAI